MFDLAIDSKLRGCDLVKLRISDVVSGGTLAGPNDGFSVSTDCVPAPALLAAAGQ